MSSVFHRSLNANLSIIEKGEGIWVFDRNGKKYLDASSSGAGLTCIGHSHPRVIEAVTDQVKKLSYMHGAVFTSEPLEALGDELVSHAPAGLSKAFFTSGGSEAIEASLLMARQYAVEIGQPERRQLISRKNSFHGATPTAFALGDAIGRKAPFEPMLPDTTKIAATYAYRHKRPDETQEQYGLRIAQELEDAILEAGPSTVLAFIAETVGGTTSGALPTPPGYLKRIREICDRYGVLLILDEVYCGLGRTGTLHACAAEGVTPDFLVVAKGLGAGYAPMGSVLTKAAIHDAMANGSGNFNGGHTYSGHVLSCAAALAVQRTVREDNLLDNVVRQGDRLHAALTDRFGGHPHVGDIRGRGLALAIELVADRGTKNPFDPSARLSSKIAKETMERGLLCLPAGGTIDGLRGEHVMLAPPFILSDADVDDMVARLGDAVDAAIRGVGPAQTTTAAGVSA